MRVGQSPTGTPILIHPAAAAVSAVRHPTAQHIGIGGSGGTGSGSSGKSGNSSGGGSIARALRHCDVSTPQRAQTKLNSAWQNCHGILLVDVFLMRGVIVNAKV